MCHVTMDVMPLLTLMSPEPTVGERRSDIPLTWNTDYELLSYSRVSIIVPVKVLSLPNTVRVVP